jgi:hypothetical protein
MFLAKLIAWLVLYPLTLLGFVMTTVFSVFSFLFNSPVDIWIMISKTLDEEKVSDMGQ